MMTCRWLHRGSRAQGLEPADPDECMYDKDGPDEPNENDCEDCPCFEDAGTRDDWVLASAEKG